VVSRALVVLTNYRYVDLPAEINLSDPAKDACYRQHAVVVLPGLGRPEARSRFRAPASHGAITMLTDAPNKQNAIKFLQLLFGPAGTSALKENGPDPLFPALVSPADFHNVPESLRPMVDTSGK